MLIDPRAGDNLLAWRLYWFIRTQLEQVGAPIEQPRWDLIPDYEFYPVGAAGIIAFRGEWLHGVIPHDDRKATVAAYRIIQRKLRELGIIRSVVYVRHWDAVILNRRLGMVPVGYDKDYFVYYEKKAGGSHGRQIDSVGTEPATDCERAAPDRAAV